MKIVVIGSAAFNVHGRPSQDLDLIVHERDRAEFESRFGNPVHKGDFKSQYGGRMRMDVEWAYLGTSAEMILNGATESKRIGGVDLFVATIDHLACCAASACSINIRTEKHLKTLLALRQSGAELDEPVLGMRLYEAGLRMKYNPSRYFRRNEDFFRDSVVRSVPHDQLHAEFMLGSVPCYLDMKRDLESAHVDLDIFNKLPFERQCECIWEEALVLGWERDSASMTTDNLADKAKSWLHRLGTNYLQLEFRPFLWWNYEHLINMFPTCKWRDRVVST